MASHTREAPTTVHIDVHSYTQLIISSYGYTTAPNPRASTYREVGALIQDAMRQVDGITYQEGPIAEVLYTASGGSVDYADKVGALGICFEMRPSRYGGGGFAPPVSQILPGSQETYEGVMVAIDYAKGYQPPAPTPAPPAPPPGTWTISGSGCVMNGDCISSNNHPSSYGNNEQCTVSLADDLALSVQAFSTESGYDFLRMGGSSYSGSSGPASGTYSGSIARPRRAAMDTMASRGVFHVDLPLLNRSGREGRLFILGWVALLLACKPTHVAKLSTKRIASCVTPRRGDVP